MIDCITVYTVVIVLTYIYTVYMITVVQIFTGKMSFSLPSPKLTPNL
jgi:hypothetical protein